MMNPDRVKVRDLEDGYAVYKNDQIDLNYFVTHLRSLLHSDEDGRNIPPKLVSTAEGSDSGDGFSVLDFMILGLRFPRLEGLPQVLNTWTRWMWVKWTWLIIAGSRRLGKARPPVVGLRKGKISRCS